MIIAGIDPGKQGAVCLLDGHTEIVSLKQCPVLKIRNKSEYDIQTMVGLIALADAVWLEKVHAMPKQGVTSMFSFGRGFGIWEGIIVGRRIALYYVAPQTWKKVMMRDLPRDKNSAILRAKELCPKINLKPTERSRKDSVALAEAYLIARYGLEWGNRKEES